jgi:hypothetical protein
MDGENLHAKGCADAFSCLLWYVLPSPRYIHSVNEGRVYRVFTSVGRSFLRTRRVVFAVLGTHDECLCKLTTFGIPTQIFPFDTSMVLV